MGLSASMFSGITGLQSHGEKMSVIGNNIANVSTIGFKGSRMEFEDSISHEIPTSSGIAQIGRGVRLGSTYADFGQGSFETTSEATDMAIGGNGFFMVKVKDEETTYYTRAGNFRFDKDGFLVDNHGYVLQGWQIDQQRTSDVISTLKADNVSGPRIVGTPVDIQLENFQSSPRPTNQVAIITNLDSQDASNSEPSPGTSEYLSLFNAWDATDPDAPIQDVQYAYQSTIKVYDGNGTSHDLTVYFDQVDAPGSAGGRKVWEYIVTVNPTEDNRIDAGGNRVGDTSVGGILMTGTLTFNPAGELENMTAYTLKDAGLADPTNQANWTLADMSTDGYPMLTANFLGRDNASATDSTNLELELVTMNFGLRSTSAAWSNAATLPTLADYTAAQPWTDLPGMATTERAALATTDFSSGSTTIFQAQDGYTSGFLQNVSVDRDGVLTGRYSNGQVLELYAVTLADFSNKFALRREGGNLFSETLTSGPAITGLANSNGKGSVASNSLEQSNVDLATEFVDMINTQRGFQANSKTITTVDSMLQELINLKR